MGVEEASVARRDAHAERSGHRRSGLEQAAPQRVFEPLPGSRAVDHPPHAQRTAVGERDSQLPAGLGHIGDRARVDLEAAGGAGPGDRLGGGGRHAVAVGVPEGALTREELPAFFGGEAVPESRGVRAQAVQGGAPVAVGADRAADVPVDGSAQCVQGQVAGPARRLHRAGRSQRVGLRQESVAGDGVDRALGVVEGEGQVYGGETRTDEEDVGGILA
ncbi:hypothetical protein [Streptomyces sp. NPDC101455]|uniref:hypothetical protein n=1 Tax=Streptomyces sp. NPDC101455 TaxID=3366142 RepID=UPI00381964CA